MGYVGSCHVLEGLYAMFCQAILVMRPHRCKGEALLFEDTVIYPFFCLEDTVVSMVISYCHFHVGVPLLKCNLFFEGLLDCHCLLDPQVSAFGKSIYVDGRILVPFGSYFACDLRDDSRNEGDQLINRNAIPAPVVNLKLESLDGG